MTYSSFCLVIEKTGKSTINEYQEETSALNFRLIGLVHLVEIRPSHVGFRPTLGLVSSGQTKGVLVFVGSPSR